MSLKTGGSCVVNKVVLSAGIARSGQRTYEAASAETPKPKARRQIFSLCLRAHLRISSRFLDVGSGSDGIVPFGTSGVLFKEELVHLVIGYFDTFLV